MADYLETPGRTTLKAYVEANQSSLNIYIRQFDNALQIFRDDISDRDELKISLFDLDKKANKQDRRIIDIMINLFRTKKSKNMTSRSKS